MGGISVPKQELGVQGTNDVEDGVRGVGGEMHAFVRRRVPLRIVCGKVLSQVCSTGLHGSVKWPQCVGRATRARMGNYHLEDDFETVEGRRGIRAIQEKNSEEEKDHVEEENSV